jgi:transposase
VLRSSLLHADETHWPLSERGGEPCRHWAWCLAAEDAAFYRILRNRSAEAARNVLRGYEGIVMADGYGAYETLSRGQPGFTLAHCWAHVRRKFVDAEEHYPQECQTVLDWIGQLYAVERLAPFPGPGAGEAERAAALELRAHLREERSKPVVESILRWVYETKGRVLPQSSLGRAIAYMAGMWEGLTRFLKDPRVPLDNNHAERALRGVVIGRKNHYGSRSLRGTQVAALFYSLFETAKLRGVEPKAYVRQAAAAALAKPGTVTFPAQPDC